MSLLPSSRPDVTADQQGEFQLIGFDDDATDTVLDALASETARAILRHLHDEPRAASELADRADLSIQNVTYHLEKLEAADLVEVVGTRYSEKGREMKLYGPADQPLVVFVGTDERKLGLGQLLERFVGATGLLAVVSLLLHSIVEGGMPYLSFTGAAGDSGGPDVVGPSLPLATAIFLGGFVMLVLVFAWRYWAVEIDGVLARLWHEPLFGGRNRERSRRAGVVAVGASAALALPWVLVTSSGLVIPALGSLDPAPAFVLALVGAAAIQAYVNDGLLVSWLIVFAPMAVLGLGTVGLGLAGDGFASIAGVIGYPVVLGLAGALVLGTAGFALGAGARRLADRLPRTSVHR